MSLHDRVIQVFSFSIKNSNNDNRIYAGRIICLEPNIKYELHTTNITEGELGDKFIDTRTFQTPEEAFNNLCAIASDYTIEAVETDTYHNVNRKQIERIAGVTPRLNRNLHV